MNLQDLAGKIKSLPDLREEVFVVLSLVCLLMSGYLLAQIRIEAEERRGELRLISANKEGGIDLTNHDQSIQIDGRFVASKSGSAFHLPWCPGAKRIKDYNKIWFSTEEEAIAAGYKPAGNCEGI